jgi:uncharacterized membrane protein YphA (DoxX/SURF4 family)
MMYGTEHIQKLILEIYVDDAKKNIPFGMMFNPYMPGTLFMGKMVMGKELTTSLESIRLLSYTVYLTEVIIPLLFIFGKYIRIAAIITATYMLLMFFVAFSLSPEVLIKFGGWSYEVIFLYLLVAISLIVSK